MNDSLLKPTLDRLYADFNFPDSAADPIQIVKRFTRADDREVPGTTLAEGPRRAPCPLVDSHPDSDPIGAHSRW